MARVRITRTQVAQILSAAPVSDAARKAFLRVELKKLWPGIESATVRRNGQVYRVMDYLEDDLESYGPSS